MPRKKRTPLLIVLPTSMSPHQIHFPLSSQSNSPKRCICWATSWLKSTLAHSLWMTGLSIPKTAASLASWLASLPWTLNSSCPELLWEQLASPLMSHMPSSLGHGTPYSFHAFLLLASPIHPSGLSWDVTCSRSISLKLLPLSLSEMG